MVASCKGWPGQSTKSRLAARHNSAGQEDMPVDGGGDAPCPVVAVLCLPPQAWHLFMSRIRSSQQPCAPTMGKHDVLSYADSAEDTLTALWNDHTQVKHIFRCMSPVSASRCSAGAQPSATWLHQTGWALTKASLVPGRAESPPGMLDFCTIHSIWSVR